MTAAWRLAMFIAVEAFVVGPAVHVGSAGAPARLKAISTRIGSGGVSLVVEATQPVPHVATQSDPLTVLLDFRTVGSEGIDNSARPDDRSPVVAVSVESVYSMGVRASRVRIALAEPVPYHITSEGNRTVVEFPRRSGGADAEQHAAKVGVLPHLEALVADPQNQTQAVQPIQAQASPRNGQRYTGNPVSLDFQQADLRAVLRVFSEISGLNIVIDPAVQGTVDVALRDVPWDQALDMILRANKLGYIVDGTVVRVAPLTVLADEEAQRRKLADEQALAGELRVLTRTLSYAKAEELQGLLTKSSLSQRGTVQVDPRTNTLIVTDLQERLNTVADLLVTLDRAQPQVEIEARIVQTNKNYARQLGVQWGFNARVDPALGNTTSLAFPNSGSLSGRVGPAQGPTSQPTAVNLGVGTATSAVGLALGSVNGAFNLDVALSALESTGNGRILSTPRVTTLNNVEAEVTQGVQIPLQTIANNTITVTFKDAALTLKVTPQITAADTVIMRVMLENATPDFSRAAGPAAIPPINTQRALTTLLVNDGQTTVIGGIFTSNQQNAVDRTPGLGQIPILSWLFKRERVDDQSTELLIFITPRIVKG